MDLKLAQAAALLAATVTTGLMAGLFVSFALAVMPGLGRSGDRTFVEAMQRINEAILNPGFLFCFLGGLLFTLLALGLHIPSHQSVLPWIVAGAVLYGAMLVITGVVNVPLNDELAQAGQAGASFDPTAARQHFESRWVAWNIVRAVVNTAAFVALAVALVVHGRETADKQSAPAPALATAVSPAPVSRTSDDPGYPPAPVTLRP